MADEPASPAPKAPPADAAAEASPVITSPTLPNNMRRTVRSPRHVNVDRQMDSSVYAELVVGPDFWSNVIRRYSSSIVEQRPSKSATLLRANMAHHQAQQETPEAAVLSRYADPSGYVPGACMAAALAALGADCTERVAQSVVEQCAGSGSSGLSEHQFTVLADAIRSIASQQVIAARLRSRTPERDAAIRASLNRDLSRPTEDGYSRSSSVTGTASRRGRSPSVGGRASSAAYRRPSPSRTVASVGSARSGTHTLKSLASLHHSQRQRAEADMQERESLRRSRSRSVGSHSTSVRRGASIPPAATGVTPTRLAEKRPKPAVSEPSLQTVNVRDLRAGRLKPKGSHVRNALGTSQPTLTENRFGVPTLRFAAAATTTGAAKK